MGCIKASFLESVKEKFDQKVAYEHNNLLHPRFAAKVVAQAQLQNGWRVLDLACGTGLVTYAAAEAVGPTGQVLGVDISPGMLKQAQAKRKPGTNVSFKEGDIENIDFPKKMFDAILCASSIPYVQNIEGALSKYRAWLKPKHGILSYNSPEATYTPLIPVMSELLQARGLKGWKSPMWNMPDAATHRNLLQKTGFSNVQVERISDSQFGLQWSLDEYAERGWNLMLGFDMWFRFSSLLNDDQKQQLKQDFIPRAQEIGTELAKGGSVVDDANTFVFAVAST